MTVQSCCSEDWDEKQRFENDYSTGPISLHEINITNMMGEREREKKKITQTVVCASRNSRTRGRNGSDQRD